MHFAKMLRRGIAISKSFFTDVTSKKQTEYKETLKLFTELRTQVQQDANEIIGYISTPMKSKP
ncbi:hypothetical protein O9929_28270 [Vibrio lentus]|nr:hypothetical protein [Vibrio lentus]